MKNAVAICCLQLSLAALPVSALDGEMYWLKDACSADRSWCLEWARIRRDDGRLDVCCRPAGAAALTIVDSAGYRYPQEARADGSSGSGDRRVTFRLPISGGPYALHDAAGAPVVPRIVLDRDRSSLGSSRLSHLRDAATIDVRDHWGGLGQPRQRRVHLSREPDGGFAGRDTTLLRRGAAPGRSVAARDVRLTADQARLLLDALVASPVFFGKYEPALGLDNYPHIEIEIWTGDADGPSRFVTESVGPDHAPWKYGTGSTPFVVPAAHPGRALRYLYSVIEGTPRPELFAGLEPAPRAEPR